MWDVHTELCALAIVFVVCLMSMGKANVVL